MRRAVAMGASNQNHSADPGNPSGA